MVIVIMGVSGVGKTTVGRLLAERLGFQFDDADAFHSAANVAKMRAGIGLSDEDRAPWLASMRASIESWNAASQGHILACSTLKERYRELLGRDDPDVQFVYLKASHELVEARIQSRTGHYFAPGLLESQFAALEEPSTAEALVTDASQPVERIVAQVITALALDSGEY